MGERCYNCFRDKNTEGSCLFCGFDVAENREQYPMSLQPGTILNGKYIVGRVLGQGGFGVTYVAQEYDSKRLVAIKEFFPREMVTRYKGNDIVAFTGGQVETYAFGKGKFLEEARTIAQCKGVPGVVDVYSYFEENGTAYFAMEYVEGGNLYSRVKEKGVMGMMEAKQYLLPVMKALSEIHAKGIIHRDISPDNIMLRVDGSSVLVDFGAARHSTGEKSMSLDLIIRHGFAPIEQYQRHGKQGPFTDIYAMAATLYYLITGKVLPDSVERVAVDEAVWPSTLGVGINSREEQALMRALSVKPDSRYQNMDSFIEDLGWEESRIEPGPVSKPNEFLAMAMEAIGKANWSEAAAYLKIAQKDDAVNPEVYLAKLMVELQVTGKEHLFERKVPFDDSENYVMAVQYADDALRQELESASASIRDRSHRRKKLLKRIAIISASCAAALALIIGAAALMSNKSNTITPEKPVTSFVPVMATAGPELVLKMPVLELEADDNNDYNFKRINAELEPNKIYTLRFDNVKVTKGNTVGVGAIIYDFGQGETTKQLYSEIINISDKSGEYKCILKTPASFSDDTDILIYAGICGKTKGVGVSFEGVSLYEGEFEIVKLKPSVNTELLLVTPKLELKANPDNDYNFGKLSVKLEPNQFYTLCIDKVSVTEGQTSGIGIIVYDFSENAKLKEKDSELISLNESQGSQGAIKCVLNTPSDIGDKTDILLYAGIQGKTKGVGVTYEGIHLYKGVYGN